ncbi:hypothetical protein RHMOL_Rhmol02G0320500 [Rhododendron molle]|uniref:Uncharacterized protein n=1 Tax=Rhododendron molle TaxID=49168 RepID=A0ACC0PZP3_RHOML|nr:hypothetical protein RHMOL_Rhmol02G0320500 [Rhododendron molle]
MNYFSCSVSYPILLKQFPLVSRRGYLSQVNLQPTKSNPGYDLKWEKFPGGSETSETVLKFCYGLPISLNPNNVAALRCASELLEMTKALEDGNPISKTDAFLTFVVLSSWRDSITVLKTCETLPQWAENLQIVRRCVDSIACKVSPVSPTTRDMITKDSWWFEDTSTLRIDYFVRIITALKAKGLKPEIVGSGIMYYAGKWLPGMDAKMERLRRYSHSKTEMQVAILSSRRQEAEVVHNKEQRMIVESLNWRKESGWFWKMPRLMIFWFLVANWQSREGIELHPSLSEYERRRLCKTMDCEKLIPKLVSKLTGLVIGASKAERSNAREGKEQTASRDHSAQEESWSSKKEITILKEELEKVKAELQELQRDNAEPHNEYEKLTNKLESNFIILDYLWHLKRILLQ